MPEDNNSKDSMQNFDISDTLIEALLDFDDEPDFDEDDDSEGPSAQEPDGHAIATQKPKSEVDATSSESDDSTDTLEKSHRDEDEAVTDTAGLDAGQDPATERPEPDTSARENDEAIENGLVETQTAGSDPGEDILKLVLGVDLDSTEEDTNTAKPQEGQQQVPEQPEPKASAPQNDEPLETQTVLESNTSEDTLRQDLGVDAKAQDAIADLTEHAVRQEHLSDPPESATSAPEHDEPVEKQTVLDLDAGEDILQQVLGVDSDVQEAIANRTELPVRQERLSDPPESAISAPEHDEPVEEQTVLDLDAGEDILQQVLGIDSDVQEAIANRTELPLQPERLSDSLETATSAPEDDEPVEKQAVVDLDASEDILQPVLDADSDARAKASDAEHETRQQQPSERPKLESSVHQDDEPVEKEAAPEAGTSEKILQPVLGVDQDIAGADTKRVEQHVQKETPSERLKNEIPAKQESEPGNDEPQTEELTDILAEAARRRRNESTRDKEAELAPSEPPTPAKPVHKTEVQHQASSVETSTEARVAKPGPRSKTLPSLRAPHKLQRPTRPGPMQSAITFYERGQYEDAITEFKRLLRVRPDYPNAYQLLGTAYLRNTMISEAIESYKKLKRLQPDNIHVYENLAWIYLNLGQLDKAAVEWTRLLKLAPDRHDIRQKLKHIRSEELKSDVKRRPHPRKKESDSVSEGIHHFRNANFDAALQAFEAHGKKQPQNPNVLGYIGGTYFKKDMMEQALYAYRKALLGKPNDVLFLENVALLELKLGHTQEALARLDELAKQSPYRSDVKKLITSLRSVKH